MAIADHVSPREALRADLKDHFRELADASIERVDTADMLTSEVDPEGQGIPAWQNVPVLTVRSLETILSTVFGGPLPPPSERTAEVAVTSKAAALVVVSAECPRCHISQRMPMSVDVQMIQDRDGESLKLSAKSKEAIHTCGQMQLPEPAEDMEQTSFGLDDIIGPVPTAFELLDLIRLVIDEIPLDHQPNFETIEAWGDLDRRAVKAWAAAVHLAASDNDVEIPPLPFVLGGDPPIEDESTEESDDDGQAAQAERDEDIRALAGEDAEDEPCPFPGCESVVDHAGPHRGADDDLLPA